MPLLHLDSLHFRESGAQLSQASKKNGCCTYVGCSRAVRCQVPNLHCMSDGLVETRDENQTQAPTFNS